MSINKSILTQADISLSRLSYAVALQKLAAQLGFDWTNTDEIISKINEEIDEVKAEIGIPNNQHRLLDEIGDLLFACTNLARHLNIDPEHAITAANQKFYTRFSQVEQLAHLQNKDLSTLSLNELDLLWEQVKQREKNKAKLVL